jgi:tricarballylate dehydrogenase
VYYKFSDAGQVRAVEEVADQFPVFDVLVAGGGNAALCAALSAAEAGASVVIVESAPREMRGGNSRHTRNLRCMHETPNAPLSGSYREEEYFDDLLRVTGGKTDADLARMTIRASASCIEWMRAHGARFQPSLAGTLHLDRTNAFFLGGGKALMNSYYATAERARVRVLYDAEVVELILHDGKFEAARVLIGGQILEIRAKSLVAAAGGFESNLQWLSEIWGPAAENFLVRGTPYNKGKLLRVLLDLGAEPAGDATQCHAVAIDARAPKFDGGIVTRLDCLPLGIVVNQSAERFYDEGEDLWPKRYAIWGRMLAQQPGQIGYSIVDSKAEGRFMPSVFPAIRANTITELAAQLELAGDKLAATIARFNESVIDGEFDLSKLDNCRTQGLTPEKTHWARRIDRPPFLAYPLRPGITFTYLGVKVDAHARIAMKNGPAANMFAAGEIMGGNILGQGYLAGFGMTIGTTFGRIAGTEAAAAAR